MDTSQAHLGTKTTTTKEATKSDNLSKDELTAVLKYGAQKMSVVFLSLTHTSVILTSSPS